MKDEMGANAPLKSSDDIITKVANNAIKLSKNKLLAHEVSWLVPNFLYKNSLVMIYAAAGSGKSWFAYALANLIAKNSTINVCYIDADNGLTTLKNRNVTQILDKQNFKLIMLNGAENSDIFKKLKTHDLSDTFIVIDSIRNFMSRVNLISDSEVLAFLNDLQQMRNNGATIVFLHHQPKQTQGENNKLYKGATAFADSVDEAYYLCNVGSDKNEFLFYLEPQKCRDETKQTAFRLTPNDFCLSVLEQRDIEILTLNDKEKITLSLVREVINSCKQINQSTLAKKILALANERSYETIGKNSLWSLLNKFDGVYFKITHDANKNQKNFTQIL